MARLMSVVQDTRRRGQAVVEFALVLPVFLLLLLGAVEFGRAYLRLHLLTNAAREGARAGSLPDSTDTIVQTAVNDFLTTAGVGSLATDHIIITVTDAGGAARTGGLSKAVQGDRVKVELQSDLEVMSGTLIPHWSGTVPLRAACVFRHE